jgi:hypothetical protein
MFIFLDVFVRLSNNNNTFLAHRENSEVSVAGIFADPTPTAGLDKCFDQLLFIVHVSKGPWPQK